MRASRFALLVAGLTAALPAFLLSDPAFVPIAERFDGQGAEVRHAFVLKRLESLYLDYELVLESAGDIRPAVHVRLNGQLVATLPVEALSRQQFGRTMLPAGAARAGPNEVVVNTDGGTQASLGLRARVHNYYGVAPDVPRAAIVADDALGVRWSQVSLLSETTRFLGLFAAAVVVVWLFQRALPAGASPWLLGVPSALLLPLLLWALATPLHVWLFPETLVLLSLAPCGIVMAGGFVRQRRTAVLEIAGVTLVTLLVLEVALRATNAISPSFIFYADSYGRYRGRPGAPHHGSTLNSRGFNDRDHSLERPPGVTTRVVALGDSFVFGVVPRTANYLTLVEQALSGDDSVEVINLGVSGTEPRDYRAILVDEGLAFRPDLVLVSVYLGNDLEVRQPRWYERSYVTTLVNFLWHLNRARQTVIVAEGAIAPYDDQEPSMDEQSFLRIQMERAWLYTSPDATLSAAVERTVADLSDIRDLARGKGADCLVVLIPDETQVDATLQDEVARAWGRARVSLDFARPTRVVAAALARAGLPTVDLLPAFQQVGVNLRLYKPRDTHWNLAGNRLAAEAILPALREWRDRRTEKNAR